MKTNSERLSRFGNLTILVGKRSHKLNSLKVTGVLLLIGAVFAVGAMLDAPSNPDPVSHYALDGATAGKVSR